MQKYTFTKEEILVNLIESVIYHKYSRLSIELGDKGEKVYINVMPF